MATLTARYEYPIDGPCLITSSTPELPIIIHSTTKGFHTQIEFQSEEGHREMHDTSSGEWKMYLGKVIVQLTRDEPDIPSGEEQQNELSHWIESKIHEYGECAHHVLIKIFNYFKFEIKSPINRPATQWEHITNNPTWLDHNDNKLRSKIFKYSSQPLIGSRNTFGTRALSIKDTQPIDTYINTNNEPSLIDQIISDARMAWYDGNMRRAIIELAIATEIIIKRSFFSENTPAGAAFDYLEDKGKINIKTIDMIDGAAREAFSSSFRADNPEYFQHLDHLFRCRNKIAHRGEAVFKDDQGNLIKADRTIVNSWYCAVMHLSKWIANQKSSPSE